MSFINLLFRKSQSKSNHQKTEKIHLFAQYRCAISLGLVLFIAPVALGQNFITEWVFDEPDTELTINAQTDGSVDYTWSTSPSGNSGSGNFNMTSPDGVTLSNLEIETGDVLTLEMAPQNLQRFYMGFNSDSSASDNPNLANVTNMSGMFKNAFSFNQDINDWDVSNVTTMEGMFYRAFAFNGDITDWDVSSVVEMSDVFWEAESFNRDIGGWNVSNVVDMSSMFRDALAFNRDISAWDMSSITDMDRLFDGAESFNQDIGSWDVSSVVDMRYVFSDAVSFNQDIGGWDVSSVEDMHDMFKDADSFNQEIGGWDVSNVEDMEDMFGNNDAFNQDIGEWDVSNVQNMKDMFENASVFNQYIGDWDVSSVTDMEAMFKENPVFNQDIGSWDVSNVVNMEAVFEDATSFNQDIGDWDVSNAEEMWDLFRDAAAFNQNLGNWTFHPDVNLTRALKLSGMDCDNYSATLIGWRENNPDVTERGLGAEGMEYGTIAAEARDSLIIAQGWTIEFDTPSSEPCDGVLSVDSFEDQIKSEIKVYPNPTRDKITVNGASSELEQISIINAQGRDVTQKTRVQSNSADEKVIDISRLDAGVYVLKTATSAARVVKQ
ncbi:MAG: BspA family leucine-rich repeat surface protein [Flavobacteriales bacterium]|nr:BspA family leucine-rich repeat surface protein [Flavobacteriales bacterium]